jgi:hypothetical protein
MKLTIEGKEYPVPIMTAADFEDYEELLLKVGDDTVHYLQRNKAAVGLIVAKMRQQFSELEDRKIKESITMPKLWTLFGWLTAGKNGEAQPLTVESPKS